MIDTTAASLRSSSRPAPSPPSAPDVPAPDPQLKAEVDEFVRVGGEGKWFAAHAPQDGGVENAHFLVTRVPAAPDPTHDVVLLRGERMRDLLAEVVAENEPVAFSRIPLGAGIGAAVVPPRFAFVGEAAAAAGRPDAKAAMVLPTDANEYTLAHEFQHLKDFKDPSLWSRWAAAMPAPAEVSFLTAEDRSDLSQFLMELRGYNAQQKRVRDNDAAGAPYFDHGGNEHPHRPESFARESREVGRTFDSTYGSGIRRVVGKVVANEPSALGRLADAFAQFDLSRTPGSTIAFANYLPAGGAHGTPALSAT